MVSNIGWVWFLPSSGYWTGENWSKSKLDARSYGSERSALDAAPGNGMVSAHLWQVEFLPVDEWVCDFDGDLTVERIWNRV